MLIKLTVNLNLSIKIIRGKLCESILFLFSVGTWTHGTRYQWWLMFYDLSTYPQRLFLSCPHLTCVHLIYNLSCRCSRTMRNMKDNLLEWVQIMINEDTLANNDSWTDCKTLKELQISHLCASHLLFTIVLENDMFLLGNVVIVEMVFVYQGTTTIDVLKQPSTTPHTHTHTNIW